MTNKETLTGYESLNKPPMGHTIQIALKTKSIKKNQTIMAYIIPQFHVQVMVPSNK